MKVIEPSCWNEQMYVLSLIVVRDSTNIKQMEEHNDARRRLYAAIPNALHEGRHVRVRTCHKSLTLALAHECNDDSKKRILATSDNKSFLPLAAQADSVAQQMDLPVYFL